MLQARDYKFGSDSKSAIFKGIELMNKSVTPTLGPKGRNVAIHLAKQVVLITKDGVTVAEQVGSQNKWEEMGCELAREGSQNCNESSGDGTTSVIVFTHSLCEQALHLPPKVNVISMKNGIEKAVAACVDAIKKMSVPCTEKKDFRKVAYISSQDDEIADKVTDIFMESGDHGNIDIEYSAEPGIRNEHADGFVMEQGCILPLTREIVMEDVAVLVTDKDVKTQRQIFPIMKLLAEKNDKQLLIVCENASGEALGMMAQNLNKGTFTVCPVKVPSYGKYRIDIFKDICEATGATFVSEEENIRLDKITLEHLGRARRVTIQRDRTILVSPDTIQIKKRIADRVAELEELQKTDLDDFAKDEVKRRLATLTSGVSIIHFGAQTEGERNEKKHRITDAKEALRSAREEGVTIGGGSTYLKCIKAVDVLKTEDTSERIGIEMVKKALRSITLRVLEVAGVEDRELIVSKIIEQGGNAGYDFTSGDIADMVEIGVIEPAKVCRCVIQNAASCSKNFLSLDVSIADADPDPLEKLIEAFKR